ncbi:SAM-dependent methyltransferase [Mycolicibacterium mengxianglii]|uniref:SAM-dependent methyltransferase n=1 Tax=Mycolicibacterium mengxianglii TaxID=2736649 RepID=UPI0018D1C745|nr:SAM-dependent methyltransferase [Mycolicibacterium mengxianglii]
MPESSIVVRPEPMGSGNYTESSRLQATGLPVAIALFEQAADAVPLPAAPLPIVIADYGAGTGHNSLLPINAAIKRIRGRIRSDHAVFVVHTDTTENDFRALFHTLAEDPDSYLLRDPVTFASAVGRSFYGQILPTNSVSLGWSSWACQWLSRVPTSVPGHIHAAYCQDDTVKAAYARQAAADWRDFVAFRGRELCPGGRFVVLTMGIGDDGEFGYRPLLDAITAALPVLAAEGLLTDEELRSISLPIVGRSTKEFLAPFAPKGRFEDLSVEHVEVFQGADRFWSKYQSDGDATAFGSKWAGFCRAAVFPALAAALGGDTADPRRVQFFDRLEREVAARLAAAPEAILIPLATVVLVKSEPRE